MYTVQCIMYTVQCTVYNVHNIQKKYQIVYTTNWSNININNQPT